MPLVKKMYKYDVIIVSPNSAIDSFYVLDELVSARVNRAKEAFHTAGSKGNNMGRALVSLGGRALVLGIVGGFSGQFIAKELEREEIDHDLIWTKHESRRQNTFHVIGQLDSTVVLEPGPSIEQEIQDKFVECIVRHSADGTFLVLNGSLPPNFPESFYANVISLLKNTNVRVCVDCSGNALKLAAAAAPALIKVNTDEFWSAFGEPSKRINRNYIRHTCSHLQDKGTETLIITDGSRGSTVFSAGSEPFRVLTQVDSCLSTAGAGDTFLAGFLLALVRGDTIQDAACFASAAAAADVQQLGCGFLKREQVACFLSRTKIEPFY